MSFPQDPIPVTLVKFISLSSSEGALFLSSVTCHRLLIIGVSLSNCVIPPSTHILYSMSSGTVSIQFPLCMSGWHNAQNRKYSRNICQMSE